jgi:hypothetical protein
MRTTRTIVNLAVAPGLLLLATVSVQAQQPTSDQTSAIRASCRSDFMANCSGVQPGGADALECLKRNIGKLSGACKTAVSAVMPAPAALSPTPAAAPLPPASAPPASAPPASAPPAAAKPAKPATAPAAKLTPAPPPPPAEATAPAVAPLTPRPFIMPERRVGIEGICHADSAKLCAGTLPIGSQMIDCLAEKASSLSQQCYDAIARISQ